MRLKIPSMVRYDEKHNSKSTTPYGFSQQNDGIENYEVIDTGEIKVFILPEIPLWFATDTKGFNAIKRNAEETFLKENNSNLAPKNEEGYIGWVKRKINELNSDVRLPPDYRKFNSIVLEITDTCNLRCPHCYVESEPKKHNNLSTAEVIRVVREACEIGINNVGLTGGEIFTRKDILEILNSIYIISKNLDIHLYTNGTLLTENLLRKINREQKITFIVSLDGSSSIIHDKIRGKGSFKRTIRAIELAKKYNFSVRLQSAVFSHNIGDAINIIQLAEKLRVKSLKFKPLQVFGRLEEKESIGLIPTLQGLAQLDEDVENYLKNRRVDAAKSCSEA